MNTHALKRSFQGLLCTLVTLSLSAALAAFPLVVQDDLGREVTVEREPLRIVAMLPSHTETVCALGVCERLVGIDSFSNYPEEVNALPRLGGLFDPDVEGIIALEPDLVLVSEYGELVGALEQAGLTVYAGSAQRYDETLELLEQIAILVGRPSEGEALARSVEEEIAAIRADLQVTAAPSVYYELDATPYSAGPESFIGTLLTMAGANNIVPAELGDFPQLDPEFVVAADPEIIVLSNAPYGETAETVAARPGWADVRAVREGRVIELTQDQVDLLNRAGPRVAEGVRLLADLLHAEP